MNRWQGHLPVASLALSALLERAARGGGQFTEPERALFTACEFWAAVETHTLHAHLGPHAADSMRTLSFVYSAMGARHVARMLVTGVAELREQTTPLYRHKYLEALQQRLSRTQDPVDQLIADLAHDLGLSAVPRPHLVVAPGAELSAAAGLTWSRGRSSRAWWAITA
jgi:hypothetical protein